MDPNRWLRDQHGGIDQALGQRGQVDIHSPAETDLDAIEAQAVVISGAQGHALADPPCGPATPRATCSPVGLYGP